MDGRSKRSVVLKLCLLRSEKSLRVEVNTAPRLLRTLIDFSVPVWAHMPFVCSEASLVPQDRRRRPHGAAVTAIQPAERALLFREGLMGKNLLHFKSSVTQSLGKIHVALSHGRFGEDSMKVQSSL